MSYTSVVPGISVDTTVTYTGVPMGIIFPTRAVSDILSVFFGVEICCFLWFVQKPRHFYFNAFTTAPPLPGRMPLFFYCLIFECWQYLYLVCSCLRNEWVDCARVLNLSRNVLYIVSFLGFPYVCYMLYIVSCWPVLASVELPPKAGLSWWALLLALQ